MPLLLSDKLHILENAQNEIDTTGTLSLAAYQAVLPLLTHAGQEAPPVLALGSGDMARSEEGISPAEPKIDKQFLTSLKRRGPVTAIQGRFQHVLGEQRVDDYIAARILPSEYRNEEDFRLREGGSEPVRLGSQRTPGIPGEAKEGQEAFDYLGSKRYSRCSLGWRARWSQLGGVGYRWSQNLSLPVS